MRHKSLLPWVLLGLLAGPGRTQAPLPPAAPMPAAPTPAAAAPDPQTMAAILRADPLPRAAALRGIPTLLLYGTADHVVPPDAHERPLRALAGPACQAQESPGGDHGDPRCFDPARITAFLDRYAPGATLVALHGANHHAGEWLGPQPGRTKPSDLARLRLADTLRKAHPLLAYELGGNNWGNDAALAELETQLKGQKKVVLIGESMGGLVMWRYAERHPRQVLALVGIYPVCGLQAMSQGPFADSIALAYK